MIPDEIWHALQEWISLGEGRVNIPYASALAESIPPLAVRLRRDFNTVLSLISSHAILHRASRGRDAEGQIVATLDDYAVVRELVAELVADGVDATVPTTVRETVEAVRNLQDPSREEAGVTVSQVGLRLKLDKSAASRRVRVAIEKGYLKNLEDRKGRPTRLVTGEPLPKDVEVLPTVEKLVRCVVAMETGGIPPPEPAAEGCTVAAVTDQVATPPGVGRDGKPDADPGPLPNQADIPHLPKAAQQSGPITFDLKKALSIEKGGIPPNGGQQQEADFVWE